jgi:RNA polymerase sigma factor (sigma-70 family)
MDERIFELAHLAETFLHYGEPEPEIPGRNQDIAECSAGMLPEVLIDAWYQWPLRVLDRIGRGESVDAALERPPRWARDADLLLIAALGSQKQNECRRLGAVKFVRDPGVAPYAARLMDDMLGSPQSLAQEIGCRLASLFGRGAAVALPSLSALAYSGETRPRLAAIDALADVRSDGATPVLIDCLLDEAPEVQARAAATLAWIPSGAARAAPTLHDLLGSPSKAVRVCAAFAAAALAASHQDSLPVTMTALRQLVDDPELEVAAAGLICRNALAGDRDTRLLGDAIMVCARRGADGTTAFLGASSIRRLIEERTPRTRSVALDSFYALFYEIVSSPSGRSRIHEIIYHPWLTRQFVSAIYEHAKEFVPYEVREALIEEARQEFAVLLLQQPLLGMAPDECRKLPKFVQNKASDVVRGVVRRALRHRQSWIVSGGIDNHLATAGAAYGSPIDELQYKELERRVAEVLRELSPQQIELLQSRAEANETWAETAAALGVSPAQAQRSYAKARAKVAKALQPVAQASLSF